MFHLDKIKILIADDNALPRKMLAHAIAQEQDMELVAAVANGVQALEQLRTAHIDVVILDLIMPQLDGFGVLEALAVQEGTQMPQVVVTCAIGNDDIVSRDVELGARYYLMKPYDCAVILRRIRELSSFAPVQAPAQPAVIHGKSMDEKIASMFLTIGIPAHIKGYQFLREAVKQVVAHPDMINRITKELYPTIAQRFGTTPSKVERAIRHAIEVAWNRGRIDMINQMFGHCVYTPNDKPTNGEFIALIADKLSCEQSA